MTTDQSPANETSARYHAYLMRLWRDSDQTPWRASVTHVATGTVHRFASPVRAWAFIQAQLEAPAAEEMPVNQG